MNLGYCQTLVGLACTLSSSSVRANIALNLRHQTVDTPAEKYNFVKTLSLEEERKRLGYLDGVQFHRKESEREKKKTHMAGRYSPIGVIR